MPDVLFHIHLELWLALGLTLVGFYPVLHHLRRGWTIKRDDIFCSLSTDAKRLYLATIQRQPPSTDVEQAFSDLYYARFGRRYYILPSIFLLLVLLPLCYLMATTALTLLNVVSSDRAANTFTLLNANSPYLTLPAVASGGIVGAYLWIVAQLITSAQQLDLLPSDILGAALRLIIAAPLGYAIGSLVTPAVAPFIAFAVGAFPLDQIGVALRKLANQNLKLDMDPAAHAGQVIQLEGVDAPTAERLREASVTTVAQLAYVDPVQLSMRTGLYFDFVLDLVGQALAWIYFGSKMDLIRPAGLRGSIEIASLHADYEKKTADSIAIVRDAAKRADLTEPLFLNACDEIAGDPANLFLVEVWNTSRAAMDVPPERLRPHRRRHHRQAA